MGGRGLRWGGAGRVRTVDRGGPRLLGCGSEGACGPWRPPDPSNKGPGAGGRGFGGDGWADHTPCPRRPERVEEEEEEERDHGSASPGFAARASSRSRRPISSPNSTWSLIKTPAETQWPQNGFCVSVPWAPPPAPFSRQSPLSGRQSPSQGARAAVAAAAICPRRPPGSSTPASSRSLSSRPRGQGARRGAGAATEP